MEDEIEQFIRDSQYLANLPRAQQDRFLAYLRSAGRLPFVTFEPIDIPRRA